MSEDRSRKGNEGDAAGAAVVTRRPRRELEELIESQKEQLSKYETVSPTFSTVRNLFVYTLASSH